MNPTDGAAPPSREAGATWRLRLLGGAGLTGPNGAARLDRRTAALLAYLALEGETPKYRLAGLLWPDSPEATAKNNMRQLLRRLRSAAGADLVTGEERIALAEGVEADAAWLQARAFAGEHAAVLELTGELLSGLEYDDAPDLEEWLLGAREGLASLRRDAAAAEAEQLEREGDLGGALELAHLSLTLDPLSEEGHRRVMRLHYLSGDRAAALAAFERLREALRREFGAEPMPESKALAREIERGGQVPGAARARSAALPLSVLRPPALVGREREWTLMEEAWARGLGVVLSGPPGVGKSRLAMDFAAGKGRLLLMQGRPGDAGVPYSTHARTLRQALAAYPDLELPAWVRREFARVLPELGEGPPPMAGEADKLRFFEAEVWLYRAITRREPVVTVWDDIQFVDRASVEAGHYTYSAFWGDPETQMRSVMSFREGELSPELEADIAAEVEAGRLVLIELAPLPPEAVGELLADLELPGSAGLAAPLSRYTGGNPLFVLETVRHLFETGQIERGLPARMPPPGKVAAVVGRRLERLSEPARRLAWTAAVLGSELSLERAARALSADLLGLASAWAELEAAQVLRGDAFSHDIVYETTLAAIPAAARPHLHRAAAGALASSGAPPARVAEHWLAGGEEGRAVPFLLAAAREAEAAYRLPEAADFHAKAAEVLERQGEAAGAFEARLAEHGLARNFAPQRRREEIVLALERLADSPERRARAHRARALHSLACGERERAELEARAGLELALGTGDPLLQSQLWSALGGALWAWGRVEEALGPLSRSDELNEQVGDLKELAIGRSNLALAHSGLGRYREAVGHYERALEVEERRGNPVTTAETLNNLAAAQAQLGLAAEAVATLTRARALLENVQGAAAVEAHTVVSLADRHRELGDYARSLEFAERGVEIADALQPHFWGLAHGARAATLSALGRPEEADAAFEHALSRPGARPSSEASLREALAEHRRLYDGTQEPAAALAEAEAALERARSREQGGLELAALARRAAALLALGRPEEAAESVARAVALLPRFAPARLYRGEVLLVHARALSAAGRPEADEALEGALAWVLETARDRVPPEHRESFLSQNPANRAVLEAARRRGLAVPAA